MAPFAVVRGLARRPIRIGGQRVTNKSDVTIDLGDATTRRDLAHHSAIGQVTVVSDRLPANTAITVIVSGGVVSETTGTTTRGLDVSAGSLKVAAGTTQAIAAQTVAFGAADATNPRVDLVVVADATGVASVVAGTARATGPAAPAAGAGNTPLAEVYVPPTAVKASWIRDVRPLNA